MNNIKELLDEYKPIYDIFSDDDEQMLAIKEAIQNLSDADRIIFILYCESGSLRDVGKMLGVSHTTIYKTIKQIKKKILDDIGFIID